MSTCVECKKETKRKGYTYCSNACQSLCQYKKYIEAWGQGKVSGNRGIHTKNISRHIKRYLIEKYGAKCSLCGWNKRHPDTKVVPVEIDHCDGNAENNDEKNLRLLCPNCHSLTSSFRNLNKNNGRLWRRMNYKKSEELKLKGK